LLTDAIPPTRGPNVEESGKMRTVLDVPVWAASIAEQERDVQRSFAAVTGAARSQDLGGWSRQILIE